MPDKTSRPNKRNGAKKKTGHPGAGDRSRTTDLGVEPFGRQRLLHLCPQSGELGFNSLQPVVGPNQSFVQQHRILLLGGQRAE